MPGFVSLVCARRELRLPHQSICFPLLLLLLLLPRQIWCFLRRTAAATATVSAALPCAEVNVPNGVLSRRLTDGRHAGRAPLRQLWGKVRFTLRVGCVGVRRVLARQRNRPDRQFASLCLGVSIVAVPERDTLFSEDNLERAQSFRGRSCIEIKQASVWNS